MSNLRKNPNLLTVPLYVGGKPIEEVQEEYGLSEVVKLASNENPFGASPRAIAALQDALKNAHRYPGVADKWLRQKLAAHFNTRYGAAFTEQNFLTGNGLSDVLRMIAQAFIFDGGESIFCNPTFPLYSIYTKMFGGKPIVVPHANFRYNLNAIADAITADTRLIFICNPNNPTGTVVTRDEIGTFIGRVPPSVVVVFDESYGDFVSDQQYSNSVEYVKQARANVIALRSFSKIYGMANLRLGYALATQEVIEYLAHAQIVFNTSDAILYAGMAALDDQAHVERVRKLIAAEKQFLYDGFAQLDLTYIPSEANFILLVNLPREVKTINEGLLRRGVIVRPMGGFGMADAIRVTVGTREENEKLLRAMKEVLST